MTFKKAWETTDTHHTLPKSIIAKMIALAYPDKKIKRHHIISGGCANLNVKIDLEEDECPLILRIYLRDQAAAFREQKIGELLKGVVPVPTIHSISDVEGYRFAIADFMPGKPLRDVLLSEKPEDIQSIMHDVGVMLSKITEHEFPHAGFFDQNLQVSEPIDREGYISFAKECLENTLVLSVLTTETISKISHSIDKYGSLFPDKDENHLVHADFDPANILVNQVEGKWKITGLLDWEFSYSGSVLCDVANMLRYAHHMPRQFENAFLEGLQHGGVTLPKNWRITVHILNLVSLLDSLKRSDPKNRPNQCADIRKVIAHILLKLDETTVAGAIEVAPSNPD